jgi:hypothetical protein
LPTAATAAFIGTESCAHPPILTAAPAAFRIATTLAITALTAVTLSTGFVVPILVFAIGTRSATGAGLRLLTARASGVPLLAAACLRPSTTLGSRLRFVSVLTIALSLASGVLPIAFTLLSVIRHEQSPVRPAAREEYAAEV